LLVIVSGVVGLGGIAGTLAAVWLTGRVETNRALRAEKIVAYSAFLNEEQSAAMLLSDRNFAIDRWQDALGALVRSFAVLGIVAPWSVAAPAGHLMRYYADRDQGDAPGPKRYAQIKFSLQAAMREDLGHVTTADRLWPGLLGGPDPLPSPGAKPGANNGSEPDTPADTERTS
jgi:hypothetical protein